MKEDKDDKEEKEEKEESIKDYLVIILKESMKFALFGIVSLFSIGLISIYILLDIVKVDVDISGIIAGIIIVIFIVVVDQKKIHSSEKIADANRKMLIKIARTIGGKWIEKN